MSLIRRKQQDPTPLERAAKITALAAKGLTAQRVARRGHRNYKFVRRIVPLAILGAIGAVVAKKAKGGGDEATFTSTSTSASSAPTSTAAAATSTAVPQPTNGGPAAGSDISDALDQADVSGEGPDTPEEATGETKPSKK